MEKWQNLSVLQSVLSSVNTPRTAPFDFLWSLFLWASEANGMNGALPRPSALTLPSAPHVKKDFKIQSLSGDVGLTGLGGRLGAPWGGTLGSLDGAEASCTSPSPTSGDEPWKPWTDVGVPSNMGGIIHERHHSGPVRCPPTHPLTHSFTAVSWGRLFTDRCEDRLGDVVSRAFDDSYFCNV